MRELDVSYVLVIFGGLTGYSSDGKISLRVGSHPSMGHWWHRLLQSSSWRSNILPSTEPLRDRGQNGSLWKLHQRLLLPLNSLPLVPHLNPLVFCSSSTQALAFGPQLNLLLLVPQPSFSLLAPQLNPLFFCPSSTQSLALGAGSTQPIYSLLPDSSLSPFQTSTSSCGWCASGAARTRAATSRSTTTTRPPASSGSTARAPRCSSTALCTRCATTASAKSTPRPVSPRHPLPPQRR